MGILFGAFLVSSLSFFGASLRPLLLPTPSYYNTFSLTKVHSAVVGNYMGAGRGPIMMDLFC